MFSHPTFTTTPASKAEAVRLRRVQTKDRDAVDAWRLFTVRCMLAQNYILKEFTHDYTRADMASSKRIKMWKVIPDQKRRLHPLFHQRGPEMMSLDECIAMWEVAEKDKYVASDTPYTLEPGRELMRREEFRRVDINKDTTYHVAVMLERGFQIDRYMTDYADPLDRRSNVEMFHLTLPEGVDRRNLFEIRGNNHFMTLEQIVGYFRIITFT